MTSIWQALKGYLTAGAAVNVIVAGRIFRTKAPQGEGRTQIIGHRVSEVPYQTLSGEDGLWRARYQLDCWGSGAQVGRAAEELAAAVMARIRASSSGVWSYTDDAGAPQTVTVQHVQVLDARDLSESPFDASSRGPEAVSVDIDIVFVRS